MKRFFIFAVMVAAALAAFPGNSDSEGVVSAQTNNPPHFIQGPTTVTTQENYGPRIGVGIYGVGDNDGDTVNLTKAGADAARFTLQHSWGNFYTLDLNATPDYENPDDANADRVYEVTLQASDGTATTNRNVTVTVQNVDEPPAITGLAAVNFAEHAGVNVGQYTAADPEGAAATLTLGGTDAASFTFANSTLAFKSAPDFETKNSYSVTFTATDQTSNTATLDVTITITDVDEASAITLNGAETLSIAENSSNLALTTYTATDPGGGTIAWSLEGADATMFTLSGGALSLKASPDYETKNLYTVTVKAAAGSKSAVRNVVVTVTDVTGAPVISGGGSVSVNENHGTTNSVRNLTDTNPEGGAVNWTLSGTDAGDFAISSAGALTFSANPDYEAPADDDGDNVYTVTVTATATGGSDSTSVTVTVQNVDEGPVITGGPTSPDYTENGTGPVATYTATDPEGDAIAWSVEGTHGASFDIGSASGVLRFKASPNYETATVYIATVKATANGKHATRDVIVDILNVNEPPVISGGGSVSVNEHHGTTNAVRVLTATDPEDSIAWTLSGTDAGDFAINGGTLTFSADPDFESPADSNGDNVYHVTVTATAGSVAVSAAVTITILNGGAEVEPVTISGDATASINENATGNLVTLTADDDGASSSFTWTLPDNPSGFSISNGTLSVASGLNHEADDRRMVTVRASNGHHHDDHLVTVTVNDVNEPPVIRLGGAFVDIEEHGRTWVTNYAASDPEGDFVTGWSLTGIDAGDFTLDSNQHLRFKSIPDYEKPVDSNKDNVYRVNVNATATGGTGSLAVTVTVTDTPPENEPVVITGPTTASIAENRTGNLVTLSASSDAGGPFAWRVFDHDAEFSVTNGVVRVKSPLDHEAQSSYSLTIQATNPYFTATNHTVTVTVNNVNEPPVISGEASVALNEHSSTEVGTYTATDPEGDAVTYSLAGTDRGDFSIDQSSGVLSFKSMPNYEAPADSGGNNVYNVTVRATANGQQASKAVTITVNDIPVADEPLIVTGGATASIAENTTGDLLTLTATSDAGGPFTWTVDDDTNFSVTNGVLRLKTALNHEEQSIYTPEVTVNNPYRTVRHVVRVTVTNVDEPPVVSGNTSTTVGEDASVGSEDLYVTTYQATDPEGDTIRWRVGGTDGGDFNITENGRLRFRPPPDYEAPADSNQDNIYRITILASALGKTDPYPVTVTVTNVNEAPVITGPGSPTFDENSTDAVATYTITDPENDALNISISNTDDFTFTNNVLRFKSPPNYEWNTRHRVTITATESASAGYSTSLGVVITINDVNEPPEINSGAETVKIEENAALSQTYSASDPEGDAISWGLAGADRDDFTISDGGVLSFASGADYDSPADADKNNVYQVTVQAIATGGTGSRAVAVTVTNVDEPPVINGLETVDFPENGTGNVASYTATDPEGAATTLELTGGTDVFTFTNGALRFKTPPDHETATSYSATLQASDGNFDTQKYVTVNVSDVNEPPVITGSATHTGIEGVRDTFVYSASDPEDDTLTDFSLSGNDSALFTINSIGWLSFSAAPDFEAPSDSDRDNVYEVTLSTSDDEFTTSLAVAITVQNVNEAPAITGNASPSFAENATGTVATYSATDPEGATPTLTVGGTDADSFNLTSGVLTFVTPPNYEAKSSYSITITASDDSASSHLAVTVTITNVNEPPAYSGDTELDVPEAAGTAIKSMRPTDPEGDSITYSLGGTDAEDLTYSAGALSFKAIPDYESPADADGDNVYEVTLQAAANGQTASRAVTVTVTNVDEAPAITGGPAAPSYVENDGGPVATYTASDPEGDAITWSLEGTDAGSFDIDDGVLTFKTAPDYDAKSSYSITVKAAANGKSATRAVTITVTEGPRLQLPGWVTGLTATATHDTVSLRWSAPSGGAPVTGYKILRRAVATETDFQTLIEDTGNTNTTYTDSSSVQARTRYAYRVRAVGSNGAGQLSALASVLTDYTPLPGRVTGLTATVTHDTVSLSWTAPTDGATVTGYKILRRAVDSETSFRELGATTGNTATTYTDSTVTSRVKYSYRVRAVGEHGEGEFSMYEAVIPPRAPLPGQVTGLTARATAHNRVSLSWTAPTDGDAVTGYRILRRAVDSEDSYQTLSQNTGNTSTTYTDSSSVQARTKYAYRVLALGEHGAGERSTQASVITPQPAVPGQVTGLTARATAHNQVSLSWSAPTDGDTVTGYRIMRRAVDSETSYQTLTQNTGNTNTTYTDDSSVQARTKYAYRVLALGANGAGERSEQASVITPQPAVPGQVTGLTARATAHNRVSLSWTAPTDGAAVTGYRIMRRAVDSESNYQTLSQNTGDTATTYTDSDSVQARTKYAYRVLALGEHGAGERSTQASVITPLPEVPGQVTGLTATATEDDTVSLSWTAPTDGAAVTGYRIWRRVMGSENSLSVVVQNTGNTGAAWTDSNVSTGTNYVYRVQGLGEHGGGELSAPATVTVPE